VAPAAQARHLHLRRQGPGSMTRARISRMKHIRSRAPVGLSCPLRPLPPARSSAAVTAAATPASSVVASPMSSARVALCSRGDRRRPSRRHGQPARWLAARALGSVAGMAPRDGARSPRTANHLNVHDCFRARKCYGYRRRDSGVDGGR
jgi:hypothetical protein